MKKYFKKVSVAAIACAVAVSSLPGMTVFASENQSDTVNLNSDWSKDIDSMLEGQDYVEGEVIAVFDNSVSESTALSTLSDDEDSEDLGTLSDEAVEETVDADLNNSDEAAAIRIISSEEKSTEELLNELALNPAVICAEPNYITDIEDLDETENTDSAAIATENATEEVTANTTEESDAENTVAPLSDSAVKKLKAEGTAVDLIEDQGYEAVGDLTSKQWGYNNEPDSLYSIHSPNWNTTGGTNVSDDTAVVGVIDTGIDYTHPDLKDLIVDLSKYSAVAGEFGYNATDVGDPTDPMDEHGHGTHCAGIIASKWDGTGTSGVASGVKIAAVKAATGQSLTNSAIARGFMCFIEATENGLNLKSVNCSFGSTRIDDIELMMINELGKLGVVTCYAAGNSSNDNDEMAYSSSGIHASPYGVIVDADNAAGVKTYFSCYGQSTTDLLAPGCTILSAATPSNAAYWASVDKNRLSYDGFTGEAKESGVKVYSLGIYDTDIENVLIYTSEDDFLGIINDAEEAGTVGKVVEDEDNFDGDGYSYEIEVPALTDTKQRACYLVEMPIDEEDVKDLTGFSMAVKSSLKQTVVWANPFMVSTEDESEFTGAVNLETGNSRVRPSNTWANNSLNLLYDDEDQLAYAYYNGRLYFVLEVQDYAGSGDLSTLRIDSVGAGYSNLRYVYMDGTSMATPAVTGATAVVYSELEESGKLDGLSAAEKAAYVADTVKARTTQREEYKSICTTEGAFDFEVTEAEYTPVIDSSEPTDQGTVVIEGNFLGTDEGTIKIDGKDCEVESWSDTNVVVKLPDGLENGRYGLDLTKSNGKTATKKIIIDTVDNSEEQAFEGKIELPDELKGCQLKITAVDGKLYAFPQTVNEDLDNPIIWNTMWCYDKETNEWKQCADIPVSEKVLNGNDNDYGLDVAAYKDYVVAQVNYISDKSNDTYTYADEFFLYNPKKNSWTKLNMSATDAPESAIICGSDAGLFLVGGYCGEDTNNNIYKINFNLKKVETGVSSVKATGLKKVGEYIATEFGYGKVSSYGNDIFITSDYCGWLKWSEDDQKFEVQNQKAYENIGGTGKSVAFVAAFAGCLTPSGAVITAMNGNDYTDRGYDTFYLNEDGTRVDFGKVASYADLYNSSACYSDGIMYVWGDSEYTEESTLGVLVYTKVNMPRIESAKLSGDDVTLTWRALDYNAKIRLFYKENNGSWKVADDFTGTSCTIKDLKNGTKYSFTLRAVEENGIEYLSSYDADGTSVVYLTRPVISKVRCTSRGNVVLKWTGNDQADGYQIICKRGNTKTKINITSKTTVKKIIQNLKKGKTYKIYVKSYKKIDGKTYFSKLSKAKKITIKK